MYNSTGTLVLKTAGDNHDAVSTGSLYLLGAQYTRIDWGLDTFTRRREKYVVYCTSEDPPAGAPSADQS